MSFANAVKDFLRRLYAEIASVQGFLKLEKRVFIQFPATGKNIKSTADSSTTLPESGSKFRKYTHGLLLKEISRMPIFEDFSTTRKESSREARGSAFEVDLPYLG